jgi:hypothetical protein
VVGGKEAEGKPAGETDGKTVGETDNGKTDGKIADDGTIDGDKPDDDERVKAEPTNDAKAGSAGSNNAASADTPSTAASGGADTVTASSSAADAPSTSKTSSRATRRKICVRSLPSVTGKDVLRTNSEAEQWQPIVAQLAPCEVDMWRQFNSIQKRPETAYVPDEQKARGGIAYNSFGDKRDPYSKEDQKPRNINPFLIFSKQERPAIMQQNIEERRKKMVSGICHAVYCLCFAWSL